MNTIKIVRLKNGEDIIGSLCNKSDGDIDITEPMCVSVVEQGNHQGLVMSHWLPVQLIKKNEITINSRDVLTVFEPNEEFCEYYENTVEKLHAVLKAKELTDAMTDEEIEEVMESLIEAKGQVIH
jgi:SAM-dependent MidA family methyltransferase